MQSWDELRLNVRYSQVVSNLGNPGEVPLEGIVSIEMIRCLASPGEMAFSADQGNHPGIIESPSVAPVMNIDAGAPTQNTPAPITLPDELA